MKRLLLLVAIALSLSAAAPAGADSEYDYDRWFSTVARQSLWHSASDKLTTSLSDVRPIGVRCYRDERSFEQTFQQRSRMSADKVVAYYAGGRDIHLRNGTCANIRLFLEGRRTVYTAGAFSILLHESLHRQGLVNERLTTCYANESVRWGVRWLGFTDAQALRARNLAFTYTRIYAPRSYRMGKPNCLLLTRRSEWIELV